MSTDKRAVVETFRLRSRPKLRQLSPTIDLLAAPLLNHDETPARVAGDDGPAAVHLHRPHREAGRHRSRIRAEITTTMVVIPTTLTGSECNTGLKDHREYSVGGQRHPNATRT